MKQSKHTRRFFNLVAFAGVVALAGAGGIVAAQAQQKAVKLGITLPLTGADADDAGKIQHGTIRISVCERAIERYAAMALMKRSPKMTAN